MGVLRLISFVAFSIFALAIVVYPQTEIVGETAGELFSHLKKYSGQERDEEWGKYEGRVVRWTGSPRPFGTRRTKRHQFLIDLISEADVGPVWMRACFPEKHAEKLRELTRYDSVVFIGTLARYSSSPSPHSAYHFLIEGAKLVEIIKARSIVSIVGHKLSLRRSRLFQDHELWELEVILKNEGRLPLTDASLEAEFRRAKGTKEGVGVGPESDQRVQMSLMEALTVGKKKRASLENPSGVYTGIIRLRDKNGRLLVSKPFSEKLPPTEPKQSD